MMPCPHRRCRTTALPGTAPHVARSGVTHRSAARGALLLVLLAGCHPTASPPHEPPASDLGRVVHAGRDGVWINLGSRQGLARGMALWVWDAASHPPFRSPPRARLEVVRAGEDRARCELLEGMPADVDGGWVVWDGDGTRGPDQAHLAVAAPPRLPDPSGWPTAGMDEDGGGGAVTRSMLSALAYQPLVVESPHGILPGAARRWSVDATGLVWSFEPRHDLRWSDGESVTPEAIAEALRQAVAAEPPALAATLLAAPPRRAGNRIELVTRTPIPDLPRLLTPSELALVRGGLGTGPYRLAFSGRALGLERVRAYPGPLRIDVVPDDPSVNFYLGRIDLWRGLRPLAPVDDYRLGATDRAPALQRRPAGELWVVLAVDPAQRHRLPELDREALRRTYLGDGVAVASLAELVCGPAAGSTGAASGAAPTTAAGPDSSGGGAPSPLTFITSPADQALRIIVPHGTPGPVEQLAARLQALLIRSGTAASLEHGDPRTGDRGTLAVMVLGPRSADPHLRLWDLLDALGWRDREARGELRTALAGDAAHPDPGALEALCAEIAARLGIVPIARLPVDLWLRDAVTTGPGSWGWPHLWVEEGPS